MREKCNSVLNMEVTRVIMSAHDKYIFKAPTMSAHNKYIFEARAMSARLNIYTQQSTAIASLAEEIRSLPD